MIQVCVIFNGHAACQNFQKLQQQVSPSKLGTRGCLFSSNSLSLSQKKPSKFHHQHWVHVAFHQTLLWWMMQLLKHTQSRKAKTNTTANFTINTVYTFSPDSHGVDATFETHTVDKGQKILQQISPPTLGTRGRLFSSDSLVVDDATFETHTESRKAKTNTATNFTTNTGYTWLPVFTSSGSHGG